MTTVNIHFTGEGDTAVKYSVPAENFQMPLEKSPDGGYSFSVVIDRVTPSYIVNVNNGHSIYGALLLEPGKTHNVTFDRLAGGAFLIDDVAQQAFYDWSKKNWNISYTKYYRSNNDYTQYPLDTVGGRMFDNFLKEISLAQAVFDTIPMSEVLRQNIEREIEFIYISGLSVAINSNLKDCNAKGTPMYTGFKETWERIFKEFPVSKYVDSQDFFLFLNGYVREYLPFMNGEEIQTNFESNAEGYKYWEPRFRQAIEDAIEDPVLRSRALGVRYFYLGFWNKSWDPEVAPYIEDYLRNDPDPFYIEPLENYLDELEKYQIMSNDQYPEGVIFVDGYDSYEKLADVIAIFKGEPLFIDFWFHTCRPCLEEMEKSDPLKDYLHNNGIELLYISVDNEKLDEKWRSAIKKYELSGYHVRASQALHMDINNNYGINLYPRYMLVDADGTIVINRALEPSKEEELFRQIEKALGMY